MDVVFAAVNFINPVLILENQNVHADFFLFSNHVYLVILTVHKQEFVLLTALEKTLTKEKVVVATIWDLKVVTVNLQKKRNKIF